MVLTDLDALSTATVSCGTFTVAFLGSMTMVRCGKRMVMAAWPLGQQQQHEYTGVISVRSNGSHISADAANAAGDGSTSGAYVTS